MPLQGAALNRGAFFCIRRTVFGAWPEAQPNFLLWSERQVRLQGALARSYCDTYSNLFFSSPDRAISIARASLQQSRKGG